MFLFIIFLLCIFFIYNINIYNNIHNIHKNYKYSNLLDLKYYYIQIFLFLYSEFLLSKFFLILTFIVKGLDGLSSRLPSPPPASPSLPP